MTVVGRQTAKLHLLVVDGDSEEEKTLLPARSAYVASNSGSVTTHQLSDYVNG